MRLSPTAIAGVALAVMSLMPLQAAAITPTDPEPPETPETEVEKETPTTEVEPKTKDEGPEKPVKQQPKKPVVVTKPKKPEVMIYPVPVKKNYCPAGLQPVTISGVISCGQPNKSVTYNQMLSHPAPKVRHRRVVSQPVRSARPRCLPGVKGCSDH